MNPEELVVGTLPGTKWYDVHGDGSRLRRIITINDTYMHLDSIHVQNVGAGHVQSAVSNRDSATSHSSVSSAAKGNSRQPRFTADSTCLSPRRSRDSLANRRHQP